VCVLLVALTCSYLLVFPSLCLAMNSCPSVCVCALARVCLCDSAELLRYEEEEDACVEASTSMHHGACMHVSPQKLCVLIKSRLVTRLCALIN
jgi:hypothetical protein